MECYERCLANLDTADETAVYESTDSANDQIGRERNLVTGHNFNSGKPDPSLLRPSVGLVWTQPYQLDRQLCGRTELSR